MPAIERNVIRRIVRTIGPVGVALALAAAPASAAEPSPAELQRATSYLRAASLVADMRTPPMWLANGHEFVFWDVRAATWGVVDARTGARRQLIGSDALRQQLAEALGKPVGVLTEPQSVLDVGRERLLFRTAGQTFVLPLTGTPQAAPLPSDDRVGLARLDGAATAPDGEAAGQETSTGVEIPRAGQPSLVFANDGDVSWEFPERGWSPNSRHVAVWRIDNSGVHKIAVVDYLKPLETTRFVPYEKSGTPLPKQRLVIVDRASGARIEARLPDDEGYGFVGGWRPDGSAALVMHLTRDGKRLTLYEVRPDGRATRLVTEERPETFVTGLEFATTDWRSQVSPLPDNRHFVWVSERDGWRHAYLYDYSGRLVRRLTRGAFPIRDVFVGSDNDSLFVTAATDPARPYERALHRVPTRGGAMREISRGVGSHQVSVSPSGRYFVDGYSTLTQPRVWSVGSSDGRSYRQFAKADASALAELGYQPPEPFSALAADGKTRLYGVLYKPAGFDPSKRYAVIDQIYAGPWLSIVPWGYLGAVDAHPRLNAEAQALAQAGFVVMVLDARGTPGRSKAFLDANYGRIGQTEIPDHVAVLRQVAASRPYMDLSRAGIYGHSWGGYYALRGMLTAPETFKAGYAGAPGSLTERALVNEPNLGLPSANPQGRAAGVNEPLAGNLRGALRIMHGTADTNAPLSTTMRMADALINAGKHFELLIMPGQPHGPIPPLDAYYLHDRIHFFRRELGTPRD